MWNIHIILNQDVKFCQRAQMDRAQGSITCRNLSHLLLALGLSVQSIYPVSVCWNSLFDSIFLHHYMDTQLEHTNNFVIYSYSIWNMLQVAPGEGNGSAFAITEAKSVSINIITLATAQNPSHISKIIYGSALCIQHQVLLWTRFLFVLFSVCVLGKTISIFHQSVSMVIYLTA